MLITASEYSSMGFPAVSGGDVESCIKRSGYIISALTEGRAEKSVEAGGKPAELVKQAAGFQTYILLRENERYEKSSHSGSEKVLSVTIPTARSQARAATAEVRLRTMRTAST